MKFAGEYLKDAATTALVFLTFIVLALCVAFANMSGWFEFSEQDEIPHRPSEFVLEVNQNGETVYRAAEGVSDVLKEELLSTTYPNPESAMHAATGAGMGPWWGVYLGMRSAGAHAVKKCTTQDGVVSEQTGSGRHLTYHRFDRDGYRYTKTYHQVLTQSGWVTTDVFYAKIDKGYC